MCLFQQLLNKKENKISEGKNVELHIFIRKADFRVHFHRALKQDSQPGCVCLEWDNLHRVSALIPSVEVEPGKQIY